MLDTYITLLASFKESQISTNIIDKVHERVLAALTDKRLNKQIAPYFSNRQTIGVPFTDYAEDPDIVSQIKKLINALYYARLTFVGLEQLDLTTYTDKYNSVKRIFTEIMNNAYEAASLATHFDVSLHEMFPEVQFLFSTLEQYNQLTRNAMKNDGLMTLFKDYPETAIFATKIHTQLKSLQEKSSVNSVGGIAGVAIKQMQPNNGSYDYEFLTQFVSNLPDYINDCTQQINALSSEWINHQLPLNDERLAELRQSGLDLLNDLEHLKGSSLFVSFKFLKYIHIINNIIALTMSSLEEISNFNESSQVVLRGYIAKLKYDLLPNLFGLVDKIEVNFMLKPGTLAIPLMDRIKSFYATLIYYTSKLVDFESNGEELLSIEDSRFVTLRLEQTYSRINEAQRKLFHIEKAQSALVAFYQILEQPEYANCTIHQLPEDTRTQLISYYKIINPYMALVDVDFNKLMINSLHGTLSWHAYLTLQDWTNPSTDNSWSSFATNLVNKPWRWLNGPPPDRVSEILAKKDRISQKINKANNTQRVHVDLNSTIITKVHKKTDLVLFPYCATSNVFTLDERDALQLEATSLLNITQQAEHHFIANPEQLSCEQALNLHHWYDNKHAKFMRARDAYQSFIAMLSHQSADAILDVAQLSAQDKKTYRKLYNLFQPYFINGAPENMRARALNYDRYLVHALDDKASPIHTPKIDIFAQLDEHFQHYFTHIDLDWRQKSNAHLQRAQSQFIHENQQTKLVFNEALELRAHYAISHTHYSEFLNQLRILTHSLLTQLNEPMQAELTHKSSGVPFPELQETNPSVAQPAQTLALKQLFNSLYNLEALILEMEHLNDKSYKVTYFYTLFNVYGYLNTLVPTLQTLARNPHVHLLGRDLLNKAQVLLATIQEQSDAYQQTPDLVTTTEGNVQYNGLWYSLNAFFISPKHIRSLRNNNYLTTEELNKLHDRAKNASLTIEKLIRTSDSIVQLFLQSPKMLMLYKELTHKLNEFLSTSHDSVMNNFDKLTPNLFTPLVLEADQWEDRMGLKPGKLSGLIRNVMDEFHQGLLSPLDLQSQEHINLLYDKSCLRARQAQTRKQLEDAESHIEKLDTRYKSIDTLYLQLNDFKTLNPNSRMLFIETYKSALSKLCSLEQQQHLNFTPSTEAADLELDIMLNNSLNRYDRQFIDIKTVIKTAYNHYQSRRATDKMICATALEKQQYLQQLEDAHDDLRQQFITNYTKASFDQQLKSICARSTGLRHLDREYRNKLNDHLLSFEQSIKEQAQTTADIDATIKQLMKKHSEDFAQNHFAPLYHLDNIHKALTMLSEYTIFHRHSLFEDEQTINIKSISINALINIAANQSETVEKRFEDIKIIVDQKFAREILSEKYVNPLSFDYVLRCILSILEALYLYTQPKGKLYNNLTAAIKNEPTSSEILNRFGLFIAIPPKTEKQPKEQEQQALPDLQNAAAAPNAI